MLEPPASDGSHGRKVPSAIVEVLIRYFGDLAHPDYSRTLGVAARDPYRPLRDRLAAGGELDDLTDFNSDLSWAWWLRDRAKTVRASFVGPYAVVLDENYRIVHDADLESVLTTEGFTVLDQAALAVPVTIWTPEVEGTLYEFLFEFDNELPWTS